MPSEERGLALLGSHRPVGWIVSVVVWPFIGDHRVESHEQDTGRSERVSESDGRSPGIESMVEAPVQGGTPFVALGRRDRDDFGRELDGITFLARPEEYRHMGSPGPIRAQDESPHQPHVLDERDGAPIAVFLITRDDVLPGPLLGIEACPRRPRADDPRRLTRPAERTQPLHSVLPSVSLMYPDTQLFPPTDLARYSLKMYSLDASLNATASKNSPL